MLASHVAGRFAPQDGCPFRERRLLAFASDPQQPGKPGPHQPQPQGKQPDGQEAREGMEQQPKAPTLHGRNALEQRRLSFRGRLTGIAGAQLEQLTEQTLESEQLFRALTAVEISDQDVRENPALATVRNGIENLRTGELPPLPERTRAVETLLKNPSVLLRGIKQLDLKIALREQALRSLEGMDPTLVRELERKHESVQGTDSRLIDDNCLSLAQDGAFDRYIAHVDAERAKRMMPPLREIDPALVENTPQNIRYFLESADAAVHRRRTVGGAGQADQLKRGATSEDAAERKSVEAMKSDATALRRLLDVSIRGRAHSLTRKFLEQTMQVLRLPLHKVQDLLKVVENLLLEADAVYQKHRERKTIGELSDDDTRAVQEVLEQPQFAELKELETTSVQKFGISAIGQLFKLRDTREDLEWYVLEHSGDEDFSSYAQYALENLDELGKRTPRMAAAEAQAEQRDVMRWKTATLALLEDLRSKNLLPTDDRREALEDIARRIQAGDNDFPKKLRDSIDGVLQSLRHPSVAAVADTETAAVVGESAVAENTPEAVAAICTQTRGRLSVIVPQLVHAMEKHPIAAVLRLPARFKEIQRTSEIKLNAAQKMMAIDNLRPGDFRDAAADVITLRRQVSRMEEAFRLLQGIKIEYGDTGDADGMRKKTGPGEDIVIVINEKFKDTSEAAGIEEHERGHAIMNILHRRTQLFPMMFTDLLEEHGNLRHPQTGESFATLCEPILRQSPPIEIQRKNRNGTMSVIRPYAHLLRQSAGKTPEAMRDALLNEFYNRYISWQSDTPKSRMQEYAPIEQELFAILEARPQEVSDGKTSLRKPQFSSLGKPEDQEFEEWATRHDDEDDLEERRRQYEEQERNRLAMQGEGGGESIGVVNMRENLALIEKYIYKTRTFVTSYRADANGDSEYLDILQSAAEDADSWYQYLRENFRSPAGRARFAPRPEENQEYKDMVTKVLNHCTKMDGRVNEYDVSKLDTTNAKMRPKKFFEIVRFWSIADLVKFWNDSWEDVKTMYKRGQDRRIKDVGDVITGAMQNMKFPGASKYLQGMHAYHKRRYSGTEVEAANKWKDGMENEDSHNLLHFLHETTNKDAVRGIISLLCHRGEMEWNDHHVWETLNKLSRYKMPIGPCQRDDVLRDVWLRKLVTEIWDDREMYYHWRTENDSKIKSGKNGFTDTADQLSNVRGGMGAELEKQLRLHEAYHSAGLPPPQDVKPHLYEEVLEYAIRNGKMTMEDKFYYLIHGVAKGIIGIERLRSLAGEKGEILMRFPFIDFFYQKNNSIGELQRFAQETQEDDPAHRHKPGLKTTLFLYYKVARNESARARISKAISRVAENIDHEDIPFLITQIDFGTLNNLAAVISGSRQKVTIEGWKNSYVGFNTHLKLYGELAHLDSKGLDRFTKHDAGAAAQTLVSYVFLDNILTKNGIDKPDDANARPQLTEDHMESLCPSGGSVKAGEYRERVNSFLAYLLSNQRLGQFFRGKDLGQVKLKDGTRRALTLEDFVSIADPKKHMRNNDDEVKKAVFSGTPRFSSILKEIVRDNQGFQVFREALMRYQQAAGPSRSLINEGDHQYTRQEIETIIRAHRDGREAPAAHGDGHGGGH